MKYLRIFGLLAVLALTVLVSSAQDFTETVWENETFTLSRDLTGAMWLTEDVGLSSPNEYYIGEEVSGDIFVVDFNTETQNLLIITPQWTLSTAMNNIRTGRHSLNLVKAVRVVQGWSDGSYCVLTFSNGQLTVQSYAVNEATNNNCASFISPDIPNDYELISTYDLLEFDSQVITHVDLDGEDDCWIPVEESFDEIHVRYNGSVYVIEPESFSMSGWGTYTLSFGEDAGVYFTSFEFDDTVPTSTGTSEFPDGTICELVPTNLSGTAGVTGTGVIAQSNEGSYRLLKEATDDGYIYVAQLQNGNGNYNSYPIAETLLEETFEATVNEQGQIVLINAEWRFTGSVQDVMSQNVSITVHKLIRMSRGWVDGQYCLLTFSGTFTTQALSFGDSQINASDCDSFIQANSSDYDLVVAREFYEIAEVVPQYHYTVNVGNACWLELPQTESGTVNVQLLGTTYLFEVRGYYSLNGYELDENFESEIFTVNNNNGTIYVAPDGIGERDSNNNCDDLEQTDTSATLMQYSISDFEQEEEE